MTAARARGRTLAALAAGVTLGAAASAGTALLLYTGQGFLRAAGLLVSSTLMAIAAGLWAGAPEPGSARMVRTRVRWMGFIVALIAGGMLTEWGTHLLDVNLELRNLTRIVALQTRTWLRGRENVHKRYLIHVAGFNLGILMRALFGSGTPKEAASANTAFLFVVLTNAALALALIVDIDIGGETALLVVIIEPDPR